MYNGRVHIALIAVIGAIGAVLYFQPEAFLHPHLGCMLNKLTGIWCPFCGMTRDFVAMAQGQAPALNPFSPILAILAFVVYPAVVAWCWWRNRDFPVNPRHAAAAVPYTLALMFAVNNFYRWLHGH
jgi:hypothetical protein